MSQEVSLRSRPPDGALVVVEGELDEGVALAEVDPVQPELHLGVVVIVRVLIRPLRGSDVFPFGGL